MTQWRRGMTVSIPAGTRQWRMGSIFKTWQPVDGVTEKLTLARVLRTVAAGHGVTARPRLVVVDIDGKAFGVPMVDVRTPIAGYEVERAKLRVVHADATTESEARAIIARAKLEAKVRRAAAVRFALCPACLGEARVRVDGTLAKHQYTGESAPFPCPGSGTTEPE